MKSSQGKMAAFVLVIAMLITSVPLVVSCDSTDAAVSYDRWYYNQLDEPMQYAYDELLKADKSDNAVTVTIGSDVLGDAYTDYDATARESASLDASVNKLINCLKLEKPDVYCNSIETGYTAKDTKVVEIDITFELEYADIDVKNAAIKNVILSMGASAGADNADKVKIIHDYLVNNLTYATEELEEDPNSTAIRNPYTALVDTHRVVCEGYAKSFKMACDYYGIPNVTVVGTAYNDTSGVGEGHMWNLVLIESNWYVVDATWDDPISSSGRSVYSDIYLLAGQNTVDNTHDGKYTVAQSHDSTRTVGYGFRLPTPLAVNKYGSDNITVTLETNGGTVVAPVDVKAGVVPTIPSTVRTNYDFVGWCTDEELTKVWGGTTGFTTDTTLYAKWARTPGTETVYILTYDANGGTGGPGSLKTDDDGNITISGAEPTRDGYTFNGWNSKADGTGREYKAGIPAKLSSNLTLYAQWTKNPSSGISGIIDSITNALERFLDKAQTFLEKEDIVDGVKNLYLVAGGVVAFIIIAVIATRR